MTKQVLIAYFSKGGATEGYAQVIAEVLQSHGHQVDLNDLRVEKRPELAGYDCVVFGTGVRIGMVYRRGKRFLKRKDLRNKPLAIFLSSGIAVENPEESKQKFLVPLIEKRGLDPILCDAFPGKVLGPGGKLDDRTDPQVARRWAEKLAAKLEDTV